MRKRLLMVIIFLFPFFVWADEGRFTVEPAKTSGFAGSSGIEIKVKAAQSSSDSSPSIGEKIQLKVLQGGHEIS